MRESRYAEHFNLELERSNLMTIESETELKLLTHVEEKEVLGELAPLLELAGIVKSADFSGESRIKNSLLQRLLQKFPEQKPDSTNDQSHFDAELSDDELELAAGGGIGQPTNDKGCLLCGCQRSSATIDCDNCSFCGHPRSSHK
ncbi:hypothetical protein [Desulfosporosinus lacus]|uniref:Uncharacterized protein n=1 Tax=Desulfosporosinus lacus DSM 15449 TaxID=1121420 RepID=A0A1M5QXQ1_9FIRM|nr:hypothetical protein [Desulfosporosinus lacus]SHH18701.1 hypothetical protein SAMN02746098_00394 [Desulfosporosinus lacus DSM 15449]